MQRLEQMARSRSLIVLLILLDLVFVGLHIALHFTHWLSDLRFGLDWDRGYAELFQYGQLWGIACLLGWLAVRRGSLLLGIWSAIFVLMLADDALMLHETGSAALADGVGDSFGLPQFLGLSASEYGKFFIYAGVGLLSFTAALLGYWRDSDPVARQATVLLILSVMGLVCFGGLLDMYFLVAQQIYGLVPGSWPYESIAAISEGGELVVISGTFWFTCQLALRFGPA